MRFLQHLRSVVHRVKEKISLPQHIDLNPYRPHCPLCISHHVSSVYGGRVHLLRHDVDPFDDTCLDCGAQWHEDHVAGTPEIVQSRLKPSTKLPNHSQPQPSAQPQKVIAAPTPVPAQIPVKPTPLPSMDLVRQPDESNPRSRVVLPAQLSTLRPILPPLSDILQGRTPPRPEPRFPQTPSAELSRKQAAIAQLEALAAKDAALASQPSLPVSQEVSPARSSKPLFDLNSLAAKDACPKCASSNITVRSRKTVTRYHQSVRQAQYRCLSCGHEYLVRYGTVDQTTRRFNLKRIDSVHPQL